MYAAMNGTDVVEVFDTLLEADEYAAEEDLPLEELTENHWWIQSDWTTADGVNYITVSRNADEFSRVVENTGLRPAKLAELLGKRSQTIRLYMCGKVPPPKLVIDRVCQLDRLINGREGCYSAISDDRALLLRKLENAKKAGLTELVAKYQEELNSLN
jgi:hypothetical protein